MCVAHGGVGDHDALLLPHPRRHGLRPLGVQHRLGRLPRRLGRLDVRDGGRGGRHPLGRASLVGGALPVDGLLGQEGGELGGIGARPGRPRPYIIKIYIIYKKKKKERKK